MKAYLKSAVHGLTSEQADEIVKNASEMCVKRFTIKADRSCYVVFLSTEPKDRNQRTFELSIDEERKFFNPMKWAREYRIFHHFGKIEFSVMSLTGSGSSFGIGAEPQWTIGM